MQDKKTAQEAQYIKDMFLHTLYSKLQDNEKDDLTFAEFCDSSEVDEGKWLVESVEETVAQQTATLTAQLKELQEENERLKAKNNAMEKEKEEVIEVAARVYMKPFAHQLHIGQDESVVSDFINGARWMEDRIMGKLNDAPFTPNNK